MRRRDGNTYKVVGKILAFVVEAVIDKGCDNALTGDANFPKTSDVHHVLGELFVDDVPLLGEERVCEAETGTNGGGGGIRRDGGRCPFCSLTWMLVLKKVDSVEKAAGMTIARLDGQLCAEGVVAGEDVCMCVFWCAEEPCIGELADLPDELESKTELGDAVGDGGGGGGGTVVEEEVVECHMIRLGGNAAGGGEQRGEEDEDGDERWHQRKSGWSRADIRT